MTHMAAVPAPDGRPDFSADETHGIALQPSHRLLAHSDGMGWKNLYVSIAAERSWSGTLQPVPHPCLAYCLGRSAAIRRVIDGESKPQSTILKPRLFGSIPADTPSSWRVEGQFDVALIYLRQGMVREIAATLFGMDPDRVELRPGLGMTDPLLEQLALSVVGALRDPGMGGDALYIDHVATMIAAHLLRHHSSRPEAGRSPLAAAAAPVSRRTDAGMWRVRDYIEAHLDGDLGLDVLAREAGVNEAQFTQRFTQVHGTTPHQFVISRRIERARTLLTGSDLPIAEVALQTGFSSQSHLSDVFRRTVGAAPAAYRRTAAGSHAQ